MIVDTNDSSVDGDDGRESDTAEPTVVVTAHGPYRVVGEVAICDVNGTLLRRGGTWCLCRCGGSRNKPFCDATHYLKSFDGAESADHGSIAERQSQMNYRNRCLVVPMLAMALARGHDSQKGDHERLSDDRRRGHRLVECLAGASCIRRSSDKSARIAVFVTLGCPDTVIRSFMSTFKLDMTMMFVFHDALRRDLERGTQMTARSEGWDRFEKFLRIHHDAEDDALWPVMEEALVGDDEGRALIDEMKAEHAALEPLLEAVDDALDRGGFASVAGADLASRLREHMTHEEEAALPVIDRTLNQEQWMEFGEAAFERFRPDVPTFLPWLLQGADGDRTKAVLGLLPEPVQQTYASEWQPAYAAKSWWGT
jgi:CDGSH-type Zn-finger protein